MIGAKRIKGEHTREQDLKAVNPNFVPGRNGEWENNCQRCIAAYEARRRGINVTAKPLPPNDTLQFGKGWAKAFLSGNGHIVDCSAKRTEIARQNVEQQVLKAPDGGHFIVRIGVKGNPYSGHVFIAENDHGSVRFVDPQLHGNSKQIDCSSHWNWASGKFCYVLRVDNLKFSHILGECSEVIK